MNILICGDSYAADYTIKYEGQGWPNMLASMYNVNNLAQAGCSQYKIMKQLESADLMLYDNIIICQTSPYRIYVKNHPIHYHDILHKNCDLIYSDIKNHSTNNKTLIPIVEYFEKYFDFEYANDIHELICKKIEKILLPVEDKVIHVKNFLDAYTFKNTIDFTQLNETNKGFFNHLDDYGNQYVFDILIKIIQKQQIGAP